MSPACVAVTDGTACGAPAVPDAPVALCADHLAETVEWSGRDHGVTDLLPSPCPACGSRLGVRWPSGWLCAVCEWRWDDVPEAGLPRIRVDVVYYLRFDDRIKIGTTGNPRSRFGALRYDEVLAFERGDRTVEQLRHAQFAHLRNAGTEWFERGDDLDAHVAALAAGHPDPWALLARWRSEAAALRGRG